MLISQIIFILAFIFIIIAIFRFMSSDSFSESSFSIKIDMGIAIIGVILLLAGFGIEMYEDQDGKLKLEQDVAIMLDAQPSEVIIENSEDGLFSKSKNTRKVFFDGKTYILEVDGYNAKKITQVNE
ncbi:hypothetical protein [Virgibacillus sp.]|uniref:hypothetical protein n=1 Tax=Virgibacillus sp. TaxID=1872700 RepID=UPI0017D3E718|nr:hypothetical protein [Virgibacillus sp.]NWO12686.1 hypothetical protein [Virgibacillus sp.]